MVLVRCDFHLNFRGSSGEARRPTEVHIAVSSIQNKTTWAVEMLTLCGADSWPTHISCRPAGEICLARSQGPSE
eukprot:5000487-Alexandrium_andersonii.AAC.1